LKSALLRRRHGGIRIAERTTEAVASLSLVVFGVLLAQGGMFGFGLVFGILGVAGCAILTGLPERV
jgi:hypothetical protein